MSTCRSCNAEIIWATTNKGKAMPIDAEPNPAGNVELIPTPAGPRAIVHGQSPLMAEHPVHTTHFQTCPNADEWRDRGH